MCSNSGLCDYRTGVCKCFDGFEGFACERATCNSCSGHGTCETIDNLYLQYASTGTSDVYRGWDAGHTTGCVCDIGYTGSSCSMSEYSVLAMHYMMSG